MSLFDTFRRKWTLKQILSIHWLSNASIDELAMLELDHLRSIRCSAKDVPADDIECQRIFCAALPQLVANQDCTLPPYSAGKKEFVSKLSAAVAQRAGIVLPKVMRVVSSVVPKRFPMNESKVEDRIVAIFIDGKNINDCILILKGEIPNNLSYYCLADSSWAADVFDETLTLVKAGIDWVKYPGLKLDNDACYRSFQKDWDWQRTPEMESRRILAELNNSPRKFVANYDNWLKAALNLICDQLCRRLTKSVPEGCKINFENCFMTMEKIVENSKFKQLPKSIKMLPSNFMSAFKNDACHYVDGLESLYRDQAELVYSSIQASIQNQLPSGCSLDKNMCLEGLTRLIKSNIKPEDLVESFVKLITDSPRSYINGLPSRNYRSSTGEDKAMLARGPG